MKDIQKIVSFPDDAMHRDVDKTVFNSGASAADILKVAIISPTTVYGIFRPCVNWEHKFCSNIDSRERPWSLLPTQQANI